MEYTNEIIISLPINRVSELFHNPDNMPKWQPELVEFKHLSGSKGEAGSKSRLVYKMGGKREVEMIETITKNDPPNEFSGTYEAKGVFNSVSNKFVPINKEKTKWISHNKFDCSGIMKLMALFMPGAFKKQSIKYMQQFKEFAENY